MITGRQACEIEALREELYYATRDFKETLSLIAEDVEMLSELPNETDLASIVLHVHQLEDEFSAVYELGQQIDCYDRHC